ncbi:FYN-binding protein 1 isoform X2 [Hyla sarda]|uniref:FYN-binding protein 1 isoform X2 n=1 Tax=Hyla sarda TaxID=327740 RepID=UPI0024C47269|nr:FYN-binding protein 1 isoform X2 [Hyla sarda]
MEKNTNVKSLTAMFNAAPSPMEGAEKTPGNPALNSFQARRAEFAKSNNSTSPGTFPKKPASPKPLQVPKPASDEVKPPIVRSGGLNRFGGSVHGPSQDSNGKPTFSKPPGFKTFEQQKDEPKVTFPKPSGNKHFLTNNSPQEHKFGVKPPVPTEPKEDHPKPSFPKPSAIKASENEPKPFVQKKPQFGAKPSMNSVASPSEANSNMHGLASKTFSNSLDNKPIKQIKETTEGNPAPGPTSQVFPGVTLKPTGIKQVQSPFLKQNTDEPNDRTKQSTPVIDLQAKANHNGGNSLPPASKFPRIPSTSQDSSKEQKYSSEPKRKPLPTPAQLGPPPQKPSRPPNVDIERFRSSKTSGNKMAVSEKRSSALSAALPPPPPPLKSSAAPSSFPSLPPRNIRSTNEDYRSEDGAVVDDISEESDEECYEGIDEHRKDQDEKKRKKELEQAKKEQKEKEKKEQEIRKRFRLTEKIDVMHQAQANTDYKGGKNELSFKNGDDIEIIRVTDNPEGKWLGRMKGNYGYIKTSMVKVDYGSLPRKPIPVKAENDQDIYDDVGEQDSVSSHSIGGNSNFPPPPSNDDDIYDGVDDGPMDRSNSTFDGDVYDDVDTSEFPPPPIEFSLTNQGTSTFGKSSDYKTLKKLEKEEKEFRKKFKFTGDIRVLSTVQIATNLAAKKWGSKDLPLKPGEMLSVIQHTNNNTLLCKNNEGKYGYVSRSNIADNDGDIYDDIGEDCIYDND